MKYLRLANNRFIFWICFGFFIICSFLIYLFSGESRVSSLATTGNYYYSKQEILDLVNLDTDSRIVLSPSFLLENRLENNPLIDKVTVSYTNQGLSIDVQEKTVLGRYMEEEDHFLLCTDGTIIPVAELEALSNYSQFPELNGFSPRQLQEIAAQFHKYEDYITRDTIAKIAEIVPWEESYDDSMLKMTMQDGNVVISSIPDLLMISKYQLLLTRLQGDHVCLFLDKSNSAIDKISCDYIYMSSEEREQYRTELREELERLQREAEKAAKEQLAREQEEKEKQQENQEQPGTDYEPEPYPEESVSGQDEIYQEEEAVQDPYQDYYGLQDYYQNYYGQQETEDYGEYFEGY